MFVGVEDSTESPVTPSLSVIVGTGMMANLVVEVPPETSSPVDVLTPNVTAVADGSAARRLPEKSKVIAADAGIDPADRVQVTVCGGPAAPVTQVAAKPGEVDPPVKATSPPPKVLEAVNSV
jgi:hypothetical protein